MAEGTRAPWPFFEGISRESWPRAMYRWAEGSLRGENASQRQEAVAKATLAAHGAALRAVPGVNYLAIGEAPTITDGKNLAFYVRFNPDAPTGAEATLPASVPAVNDEGETAGYDLPIIPERLEELPTFRSGFGGGDPVICELQGTCGFAYEVTGQGKYFITCCHVIVSPGANPLHRDVIFRQPGRADVMLGKVIVGDSLKKGADNKLDGVVVKLHDSIPILDRGINNEQNIIMRADDPVKLDRQHYIYRAGTALVSANSPKKIDRLSVTAFNGSQYFVIDCWEIRLVSGSAVPRDTHSGALVYSRGSGALSMRGLFFASSGPLIYFCDASTIYRELMK